MAWSAPLSRPAVSLPVSDGHRAHPRPYPAGSRQELAPAYVPIHNIIGTYAWTYVHDSLYGASLITPSDGEDGDEAGHLALALDPAATSDFDSTGLRIDGAVEARVHGSFSLGHFSLRGTFAPGDLARVPSPLTEPPERTPIPSRWSVRVRRRPPANHDHPPDPPGSSADADGPRFFLDACAVRDDAGRPFVLFVWDAGTHMGRPHRVSLLGKRMSGDGGEARVEGNSRSRSRRRSRSGQAQAQAELTAGEKRRLGMGLDETEVVRTSRAQVNGSVLADRSNVNGHRHDA
jgi:hypothetical protein